MKILNKGIWTNVEKAVSILNAEGFHKNQVIGGQTDI
jgi:hypothetical protein